MMFNYDVEGGHSHEELPKNVADNEPDRQNISVSRVTLHMINVFVCV